MWFSSALVIVPMCFLLLRLCSNSSHPELHLVCLVTCVSIPQSVQPLAVRTLINYSVPISRKPVWDSYDTPLFFGFPSLPCPLVYPAIWFLVLWLLLCFLIMIPVCSLCTTITLIFGLDLDCFWLFFCLLFLYFESLPAWLWYLPE